MAQAAHRWYSFIDFSLGFYRFGVCGRVPAAAPGSVKAACKAYLWPLWLESWQNPPPAFAPGGVSSAAVERCVLIEIQI